MLHSVVFQPSFYFHASFHTIMLSQFGCQRKCGSQNHNFLGSKFISLGNKCAPTTPGGCSCAQLQKRILSKVVSTLNGNYLQQKASDEKLNQSAVTVQGERVLREPFKGPNAHLFVGLNTNLRMKRDSMPMFCFFCCSSDPLSM